VITAECRYQALIDEIFKQVNQPKWYHILQQAGHQIDFILEGLLRDFDDFLLAVNAVLGNWDFGMRWMFEDIPERDRLQEWHGQHN